jgi:hypothetical protein
MIGILRVFVATPRTAARRLVTRQCRLMRYSTFDALFRMRLASVGQSLLVQPGSGLLLRRRHRAATALNRVSFAIVRDRVSQRASVAVTNHRPSLM